MASPVVIVGAGVGGLAAAIDLAGRGVPVLVLERAAVPGGKLREVAVGPHRLDAGPTVFTMRWVFDELFADSGERFDSHLALAPLDTLARHAWSADERLDLHADEGRSADAIAAFAGPAEGRRYRAFCDRARRTYETLEGPFLRDSRPDPVGLARRVGLAGLPALMRISPFTTLWQALGNHFHDPRLRQLFGRYATYCGSSPFECPATLMLVAHVEQAGVWQVRGGMARLAEALAAAAVRRGAQIRCGAEVAGLQVAGGRVTGVELAGGERVAAEAVIWNGDAQALAAGRPGAPAGTGIAPITPAQRSLSAVTWNLLARPEGFALHHHNVFFSRDYAAEFRALLGDRRLPPDPTVYLCAFDRGAGAQQAPDPAGERIFCLVNAPADGDRRPPEPEELLRCERSMTETLRRCGLRLQDPAPERVTTTPREFDRMFPATGGALYGRASHGWAATFARPGSQTRLPGLYLAGGSVHPGPGVPMAALSGRLAARAWMADRPRASMPRSPPAATAGGTSTRSATTGATRRS